MNSRGFILGFSPFSILIVVLWGVFAFWVWGTLNQTLLFLFTSAIGTIFSGPINLVMGTAANVGVGIFNTLTGRKKGSVMRKR